MKYKKKIENLKMRQRWYDLQKGDYQRAHKRPGSVKVK